MYTHLSAKFWTDKKILGVSDEAKLLFLYLFSCPHRNIIGFYRLPSAYIMADLGWCMGTVSKRLGELVRNGLIAVDEATSQVLIRNFLKYNPIQNANVEKAAIKKFLELENSFLFQDFLDCLKQFANRFETLCDTVRQTVSKPMSNTESEEEEEAETETEKKEVADFDPSPSACQTSSFDEAKASSIIGNMFQSETSLEKAQPPEPLEPDKEVKPLPSPPPNKDKVADILSRFEDPEGAETPKFTEDSDAFKMMLHLAERIRRNNPKAAVPPPEIGNTKANQWMKELDLLHRLGVPGAGQGFSWQEIREIIDYAQDTPFWQPNILSAKKLREKAAMLWAQKKSKQIGIKFEQKQSPCRNPWTKEEFDAEFADEIANPIGITPIGYRK